MKSAFSKLRPNFWSRLAPSSDGDYFFVELEDAHRTWHPGDTVHGNVILVLYKPQRIGSVDLIFAGNVVVKSALVKGKGSRSVLFEQKLRLHGPQQANTASGSTNGAAHSSTNGLTQTTTNVSHVSASSHTTNTTSHVGSSPSHMPSTSPASISSHLGERSSTVVPGGESHVTTASHDHASDTNHTTTDHVSSASPEGLNTTDSGPPQLTRHSSDTSIWRSIGPSPGTTAGSSDMTNSVTVQEPLTSSRMSMHTTTSAVSRDSHMSSMSRDSHVSSMSRESTASSASTSEELEIGEHRFAFILEIPQKGLYNSLEFERGSISYVITAVAKRHGPLPALHAKRVLQLVCPVDVARLPPPKPSTLSVEIQKRKKQQGVITTTLEVGRGGYLRGESFPVKITIQHVKCVKCLRGLVVTLCRFSKVTCNDDEPQSFRKDLSQTVSPLYTDPVTFASTVSTTLRIPPDVFPTTKGHGLVSFNYCVEVVIDLAGKWDLEEDRTGFLHTDRLKRNKGVVSLWTEVIIGTDRRRWRGDSQSHGTNHVANTNLVNTPGHVNFGHVPSPSGSNGYSQSSSPGNHSNYSYHAPGHNHVNNNNNSNHVTPMSEKQLMKLREEALLPSEPTSSNSPSLDAFPSAPEYVIDGEEASAPSREAGASGSRDTAPSGSRDIFGMHQATPGSDKHEHELMRLQGLASSPYGDEDHVPQYKEKEKAPEEDAAIRLNELASVPPMEGEVEEIASAPVVNGHVMEHLRQEQDHVTQENQVRGLGNHVSGGNHTNNHPEGYVGHDFAHSRAQNHVPSAPDGFFDASSDFEGSAPSAPSAHLNHHGHSTSNSTIVSGGGSMVSRDTSRDVSVTGEEESREFTPPVITHGFTGPTGPLVGVKGDENVPPGHVGEGHASEAGTGHVPDTNKSLSDSDDIYS